MRLLFLLLSLTACHAALADDLTAGDVYNLCLDKGETTQAACRFFIMGVVRGIEFGDSLTLDGSNLKVRAKTLFCIPPETPQTQIDATFVSGMAYQKATHPQTFSSPAVLIIDVVMASAFPCPK